MRAIFHTLPKAAEAFSGEVSSLTKAVAFRFLPPCLPGERETGHQSPISNPAASDFACQALRDMIIKLGLP